MFKIYDDHSLHFDMGAPLPFPPPPVEFNVYLFLFMMFIL